MKALVLGVALLLIVALLAAVLLLRQPGVCSNCIPFVERPISPGLTPVKPQLLEEQQG